MKNDLPAGASATLRPREAAPWRAAACLAALMLAPAIVARLYTGQVWEDFLITFRHSEHLVLGNGLVYQPGERVHGFTSPLNVLLPAGFRWLCGGSGYTAALTGFVIVSLFVWGLGAAIYLRSAVTLATRAGRIEALVLACLLGLGVKLTFFAINGQEAGLWAGFLLLGVSGLFREGGDWRLLGLAWAGLMWTRPDSPIHIALLALAALAFSDDRRATLTRVARATAVCTVLYLPWFVWAWWYYGSPVPHTIIAKMNMFAAEPPPLAVRFSALLAQLPAAVALGFEPIYAEAGGWPGWIHRLGQAVGFFCACYWLWPAGDRLARAASLVYLGSVVYLAWIGATGYMFPWYFIPCSVMSAIVLSRLATRTLADASGARFLIWAGRVAVVLLVCSSAYQMVYSQLSFRLHQDLVENATRKEVGLWLKEHAAPGDTVSLEPIGYIGYYSGLKILDYPGLVSPEMVRARRELRQGIWGCFASLEPDWIVLRPAETDTFLRFKDISEHYEPAAVFDVLPRLQRYRWIPGYNFLSADARFHVFRRLPPQ